MTSHKRIDLRLPIELYNALTEIAIAEKKPINPRSGNVQLTQTIIDLLEKATKDLTIEDSYGDVLKKRMLLKMEKIIDEGFNELLE